MTTKTNQLSTQSRNVLAIREDVDPIEFCTKFAAAAARMCGAKTEVDGQAINLCCLMEGINYIEFGRRYHMIQGRPSMRSDAMLAEFRINYGGDFEIVERSAERAAINFIDKRGRRYEMEFTWKEAQESRWPWVNWLNHDDGLKDSWATPTDRKSMLFARLVSDSLRAICPELVAGIYTPEEMGDVLEPARTNGSASIRPVDLIPSASEEVVTTTVDGPTVSADGEIVDALPTVNESLISARQVERISQLAEQVGMPSDKYQAMLLKRGVEDISLLSKDQAAEIIERLESLAKKK